MHCTLIVCTFLSFCVSFSNGAACKDGDHKGENDPKSKDNDVDTATGLSVLLDRNDGKTVFDCCGFIKQWEFYAKKNTGTVHFQVWRPAGTSYSLVGENLYTVTTTNICRYQPGSVIVSHKQEGSSNQYRTTTSVGSLSVGSTFDWSAVTQSNNRKYAIRADVTNGNNPSITNLAATVTGTDATPIGTLLFTLTVADADTSDTLTTTMTTTTSLFNFDSTSLQVTSAQQLPSGTTTLNFQVTDACGSTGTGTLTIVVTNVPPVIHNLPYNTDVTEDQTAELQLYVINATDTSEYDTVTCSIQSVSPTTSIFFTKIASGSLYGIYIQAYPSLSYDSVNAYTLTVACTDSKDTVTGLFHVYITRNNAPVFTNLQGNLPPYNGSNVTYLTTTLVDINSAPILTNLPLSSPVSVSENSALGVSVFQVSYSDIDTSDTHVILATFSPSSGGSIFTVDSTTSATSSLTISIMDVNEAPVFGKTLYQITGTEGNAGTAVGTPGFDVTDPDNGATQKYSIDCPEFNMDQTTAAVTLAANYDLDVSGTSSQVTCNVSVSDGELTATSALQVTINDVNDNTPSFGQPSYTFYAQPNEAVGSVIGSIVATDADVGAFDTAAVTIVIPESTTAAPTTTTDRHVTFLEDPKNIAWLSAAVVILCGIVCLMVYQSFRSKKLQKPRNHYRRTYYQSPRVRDIPELEYPSPAMESDWRPWRVGTHEL
uniref:Cadherin-23 n=1 Tax=Magallana gigas TaxID=29159 RepID=K1PJ82_MAGGI